MSSPAYSYSEFNEFNRFQNLDGIEWKIINHLVKSQSKHADLFWKILKYNDLNALNQPSVSENDRWELVSRDNGESTTKRVFFAPFVDDAWSEQCSSVYIYVEDLSLTNHLQATVGVTVETVVHSKIAIVRGDGDPTLNPRANPNDSDDQGNAVVTFKNRATVLLKCILAELNGLYLDGIGYLQLNEKKDLPGKVEMPLWNNRSFYGHATKFVMDMASDSSNVDDNVSY